MATLDQQNGNNVRSAVEQTVPAARFSADALREVAEKTAVDRTPDLEVDQCLGRTRTNPAAENEPSETIEASYSEADSVCRLLGAHMLTITSWEEYRFIRRLQLTHRLVRVWLGLPHVARPQQRVTGEPLAFRNFGTRVRPGREVRWYQLMDNTSGWFYETDAGEPIPGFAVAKWD